MKPLVIGKYAKPRCFKHINTNTLGVTYKSSSKAWMTGLLFQSWIREFDAKMAGRNVVLLLDNAPSHVTNNLNLHNTTVRLLPPNTTSRIQPLDAGVIMSFKCHYRSHFVKWLLERYESDDENKKLDVLTAAQFVARAWNEVSPRTIHNCFRHTEILPIVQNLNEELDINDNDLMEELCTNVKGLRLWNEMDVNEYINYSEENETEETLTDNEIVDLITYQEDVIMESGNEEEEDNSVGLHLITYKEALNAIGLVELYIAQRSISDIEWLEHDKVLSSLHRIVGNVRQASLKQTRIDSFLV
jgi:hypothetical protein